MSLAPSRSEAPFLSAPHPGAGPEVRVCWGLSTSRRAVTKILGKCSWGLWGRPVMHGAACPQQSRGEGSIRGSCHGPKGHDSGHFLGARSPSLATTGRPDWFLLWPKGVSRQKGPQSAGWPRVTSPHSCPGQPHLNLSHPGVWDLFHAGKVGGGQDTAPVWWGDPMWCAKVPSGSGGSEGHRAVW